MIHKMSLQRNACYLMLAALAGACICSAFSGAPTNDVSSHMCSSNIMVLRKAILPYTAAHEGWLPTNLMSLEPYLDDPTKLVCPADTKHPKPVSTNWSDFRPDMITYVLREKHVRTNETLVYLQCIPHQHIIWSHGPFGIYRGAR